jgi:phytoene synthase
MRTYERQIFTCGSKTFYHSALLFSKSVRDDVATLYAFVRVADDYVDAVPQDRKGFLLFREYFEQTWKKDAGIDPVISGFVALAKRVAIPKRDIDAFLNAMQSDLSHKPFQTLAQTNRYMYGSAEVIGLMLARIMHLSPSSYTAARRLGRAFQYVNFLRDIKEDIALGRQYIPQDLVRRAGFRVLCEDEVRRSPRRFLAFMKQELHRYRMWQSEGMRGLSYLPLRERIAVRTAVRLYDWTARRIEQDPFIIFSQKIKPTKKRIFIEALKSVIHG